MTSRIDRNELQDLLEGVRAQTGVPGIGAALFDGEEYHSIYAGVASATHAASLSDRSRFEVACLMKLLVSLLTLELEADGILDLESPVHELLTDLPIRECSPIRVRHLLTHTSGYLGVNVRDGSARWGYSWNRFIEHLRRNVQLFTPGAVFNYEHSEHVILGKIIRRVCGTPVSDLLKDRILAPLGIDFGSARRDSNTDAHVAQHIYSSELGRFTPVNGPGYCDFWATSLPDLTVSLPEILRVAVALAVARNTRVFASTTVAHATATDFVIPEQVTSSENCEEIPRAYSPGGVAHYRAGMLGHNGSAIGHTCALRFDPQRGFAMAIGVNAWVPAARDLAASRIQQLLAPDGRGIEPGKAGRAQAVELSALAGPFCLNDLPGDYVGSFGGSVSVSLEDERLQLECSKGARYQTTLAVTRQADGRYLLDAPAPCSLVFSKDPDRDAPMLAIGVYAYKKTRSE
jgi:CubicO group peptidase (beta-lactamase class C family)